MIGEVGTRRLDHDFLIETESSLLFPIQDLRELGFYIDGRLNSTQRAKHSQG